MKDLERVADLFAYCGTNVEYYDERTVQRYGQDIVDKAKELATEVKKFEEDTRAMFKQIKSSPIYPLYIEMINSSKSYSGNSFPQTTFKDIVGRLAS